MKRPLRMDEIDRYALQGILLLIAFVLIIAGILVASGCTYVYVFDNELGDVGVKSVDERIDSIEQRLLGEDK